MYYVYLLLSQKDNGFYIGCCSDIFVRVSTHNKGYVESTRNRLPMELIYFEAYNDKAKAFERERKLKDFGSSYSGLLKRLGLK